MPELLHPGVYVQEVPAAVKPIEGVSTSTAAFVGVADKGPIPGRVLPNQRPAQPTMVTSFSEYLRTFGGFRQDSFLTYAARGFFDNGGRRLYIVRVAPETAAPSTLTIQEIEISAVNEGVWGDNIWIKLDKSSDEEAEHFKLLVMVGSSSTEALTNVVESYDNVEAHAGSGVPPANYVRTAVNSRSEYIAITAPVTAVPTTLPDGPTRLVGGDSGAARAASHDPADGPPDIFLVAQEAGEAGNLIEIEVTAPTTPSPGFFNLIVRTPDETETFEDATFQGNGTSADYIGAKLATSSLVELNTGSDVTIALPPTATPVKLTGGTDGTVDYVGQAATSSTLTGTGMHALDKVTDVNLLAIPGQGNATTINAAIEYCKFGRALQDLFFIGEVGSLDPDLAREAGSQPVPSTVADVRQFVVEGELIDPPGPPRISISKAAGDYGALYYPWVRTTDPLGTGRNPLILVPPSGMMAGLYARIDNTRGVFKAPAGTEAGVAGALAVATVVGDTDQDRLNPINLNVIRVVPGSGIVSWGARTIGSDAGWRYVPVRRMAIFLRVSIYYGIQWAVFEPNDEGLWSGLRLNIRSFMLTQFRAGAFQGSKPDDAFFVMCDKTTTTQQDIDNGVVNILVGFAPLKPAEFVVLKLSQKVNQPPA